MKFTATKGSSQLQSMLSALTVVVLFEAIAIGLPIAFFVLHPPWTYVFLAGLLTLDVIGIRGFRYLQGAHYLVETGYLKVRLGNRLTINIPLATIRGAHRVDPSEFSHQPGHMLQARLMGNNLCVLSRESDIVTVDLAPDGQRLRGRGWPRQATINSLTINVDEPDDFVEALMGPADPTPRNEAQTEQASRCLAVEEVPQLPAVNLAAREGSGRVVLNIQQLSKRFGSVQAVDSLDLQVRSGEIVGLLGANGAGKTTAIKALLGLVKPDTGSVAVEGVDTWAHPEQRRRIGYLPDIPLLYNRLTGREFLVYTAGLYGTIAQRPLPMAVNDWLNRMALSEAADRPVAGYSLGMKRKLALAAALIHDPALVVVDELTQALDAPTIRELRVLLSRLAEQGKAILVTTHIMDQAEKLCSRVVILDRGKSIASGKIADLVHLAGPGTSSLEEAFLTLTVAGSDQQ